MKENVRSSDEPCPKIERSEDGASYMMGRTCQSLRSMYRATLLTRLQPRTLEL
ncbi:hypothetical protein VTK26DRAFT_3857 [Humicola hyalothermophila]